MKRNISVPFKFHVSAWETEAGCGRTSRIEMGSGAKQRAHVYVNGDAP
jgi:hypothetical protein